MQTNRYKLIIFDWDGTLVNSIEKIATSLQAASLQTTQVSISDTDARSVIGLGLQEAVQQLHPHLPSDEILKIADAYKHHYQYTNTVKEDPFEGVETLLTQLKDNGFLLAIATGKGRPGFERAAERFDFNRCFHTTQCAGDNKSKPHPEMVFKILDELNINAEDAIMIGDSTHDMKMAVNAKIDAIAVTHGVNTAEELSAFNPLACLDRVADLAHFLQHNKRLPTPHNKVI